jgi:hypothetical protein
MLPILSGVWDLYNTDFDMCLFIMLNICILLTIIRDISKATEGYDEQENQKHILSKAASKLMPSELKHIKELLELYINSYEMFPERQTYLKQKALSP